MFLAATVAARIGPLAVVQVPGGAFVVEDPAGLLQLGGSTVLRAWDADDTSTELAGSVMLGLWSLLQADGAAILERELRPGEQAPLRVPLLGRAPELPQGRFLLSLPRTSEPSQARPLPALSLADAARFAKLGPPTTTPPADDALLALLQNLDLQ